MRNTDCASGLTVTREVIAGVIQISKTSRNIYNLSLTLFNSRFSGHAVRPNDFWCPPVGSFIVNITQVPELQDEYYSDRVGIFQGLSGRLNAPVPAPTDRFDNDINDPDSVSRVVQGIDGRILGWRGRYIALVER